MADFNPSFTFSFGGAAPSKPQAAWEFSGLVTPRLRHSCKVSCRLEAATVLTRTCIPSVPSIQF